MDGVANGRSANLVFRAPSRGDYFIPPGETFGDNNFLGSNYRRDNCVMDGRPDGATGLGVGATAFGDNSFSGGIYTDCVAHHFPYSAMAALWQGSGTIDFYDCGGWNNRTHLNIERCGGEIGGQRPACRINLHNYFFGQYELNNVGLGFGQDILLANDQGSTELWIYDPIIDPARTASTRDARRIFIWLSNAEQGNPNLQDKADVHVVINGVEVSTAVRDSQYIQWSR
jgi:hypothetical protein